MAAAEERELSRAAIRIPDHVVSRTLGDQTVVLNLRTGRYHGLNPTGGAMLESLRKHGSVQGAAPDIARDFDAPYDRVLSDLLALCGQLRTRGLIEVDVED
jgi:hypothetical protein